MKIISLAKILKQSLKSTGMALLLAIGVMNATAATVPPKITAKLDSAAMMMGNISYLHLQVVENEGDHGKFPMMDSIVDQAVIPLLNDTIELRAAYSSDTIKLGSGRRQIDFHFPMQVFDPGLYSLDPFKYVVNGDTAVSNSVSIKITAPNVTANDSISPDAGPLDPYYNSKFQKFTDKIPDFIYDFWWVILLAILLLAAIIVLGIYFLKHREKFILLKPKPQPSPYEVAISGLRKLREDQLWEHGDERLYFTRLTEIIREYLKGRFSINAMEMTSSEIMKELRSNSETQLKKGYVEEILKMADFVKFAKLRPLPDDNIQAFENALKFVEETKPVAPAEDEKTDSKDSVEILITPNHDS
jgi:hypothetical protein